MTGDGGLFGDIGWRKQDLAGGGFSLAAVAPLEAYPDNLVDILASHAAAHSDRVLFREFDEGGACEAVTYGAAMKSALRLAAGLCAAGAGPDRPVALIADNSIEMALAILAAYAAGAPVAPISPAYSLMSADFGKLRYVLELLQPGVVVFDRGAGHDRAKAALGDAFAPMLTFGDDDWAALAASSPMSPAPAGPDAPAKILFTSGSTGAPKGVINTHRMMVSNQQAIAQMWPALTRRPPALTDWLPWNHTFGGNQNFNMALFHGGALTIDKGRPTPAGARLTAETIKRAPPSVYFNVPRGYDALVGLMARDPDLQAALFQDVDLLGYAGAALPGHVWRALKAAGRTISGRDVPLLGLWGSTETGPVATAVFFDNRHPGNIGLPAPGCELRFLPEPGSKLEIRIKAPSVTPGYWRQPELNAAAFDAEGFFRMGDAGRLLDRSDPGRGVLFDGRIGENFKLTSGTWVNVGALRTAVIDACPDVIADAVVAGHDRDWLAVLLFPKLDGCRAFAPDAPDAEILASPAVRARIAEGLASHNQDKGGAQRVVRALLSDAPPDVDKNEITDKGYLNQRACLENRAAEVERLFADAPDAAVLCIED